MKSILKKSTYWLSTIAIGIILGVSLQFVSAWVAPSSNPPAGNVGAPINTSLNGQIKGGSFVAYGIGTSSTNTGTALYIPTGSVGIGVPLSGNPLTPSISTGLKIDVHGKIGADEYCDRNGLNCKTALQLGGGGIPSTAKWNLLTNSSSETYTWTNTYAYPVNISAWGGNDSGTANSCSLILRIDSVSVYKDYINYNDYSSHCGGTTIVPSGSILTVESNPYWGSGKMTVYAFY